MDMSAWPLDSTRLMERQGLVLPTNVENPLHTFETISFFFSDKEDCTIKIPSAIDYYSQNDSVVRIDAKLWPASIVMCYFLYFNLDWFSGKTIMELGAGIGLPSLIVAKYGKPHRVYIQDIACEALLARQTELYKLNRIPTHHLCQLSFRWDQLPPPMVPLAQIDLIYSTDSLYNRQGKIYNIWFCIKYFIGDLLDLWNLKVAFVDYRAFGFDPSVVASKMMEVGQGELVDVLLEDVYLLEVCRAQTPFKFAGAPSSPRSGGRSGGDRKAD